MRDRIDRSDMRGSSCSLRHLYLLRELRSPANVFRSSTRVYLVIIDEFTSLMRIFAKAWPIPELLRVTTDVGMLYDWFSIFQHTLLI